MSFAYASVALQYTRPSELAPRLVSSDRLSSTERLLARPSAATSTTPPPTEAAPAPPPPAPTARTAGGAGGDPAPPRRDRHGRPVDHHDVPLRLEEVQELA